MLESGRRVATYKLASLIALLDYAVEHHSWRLCGSPMSGAGILSSALTCPTSPATCGRDRVSLKPARDALVEAYGARCFYCGAPVGKSGAVDHVLPWSRIGLDGLANLVLACRRCNTDKSDTLPRPGLVELAVNRDPAGL